MTNKDWKSAFARYVANDLDAAEPDYVREVLFDVCGLDNEAVEELGFGELIIDY